MKRGYILLAGLILVVVILSVLQISISNMLSIGGIELSQVQTQIDGYQKENAVLKEQIYRVASLTNISQEAEKLGYVQGISKSTLVIANLQPLALKP